MRLQNREACVVIKLTLGEYVALSGSSERAGWDSDALRAFCLWLVEERVTSAQALHAWERCHLMWARGQTHSSVLAQVLSA